MRVLFTTVALPGHFYPLTPLAWACRVAGHEVLVATSEEFCAQVLNAGLPVASCGSSADYVDLIRGAAEQTGERRRYASGLAFGRIAANLLPGMRSLIQSWRPDLIVSERAEFAGPVVAAAHDIPQLELQWGVGPLTEYRQAAETVLGPELSRLGLPGLPEPRLLLNPWPASLRQPHASDHLGIRYVPYNGPTKLPDWLLAAPERPRVCLTLGTVLPRLRSDWSANAALAMLAELSTGDVELLVAVDDRIAAAWPPLPPAVRHAGWLPLSEAFAACTAVIHHGGHSTTLTALRAGRPQLVMPQFDDQFDNADAVERVGAAITLPPGEHAPGAIADTCAQLLRGARFGRAAEAVAAEMAATPSPAHVLHVLEDLAARKQTRPRHWST